MMSRLLSFIHVYVLWIIASQLQVHITLAQSHPQCYVISVDSSISFQQAIDLSISGSNSSEISCIRIEIPSGNHTITSQTVFPVSMEFIGVEDGVYISCNYTWTYNYTWSFSELDSVTINGIYFESCPRPLRLEAIAGVEIQNCSFR